MKSEKEESLERIRKTQSELHAKLAALDREISALSDQHGRSPASDEALESSMAAPEAAEPAQRLFAAAKEAAVPPPLPPSIPETQAQQEEPGEKVLSTPPAKAQEELPPLSRPDSVAGIELKLGTYWLVRIGVLMVLTGFVFLAKHFLTSDEVAAGLKLSSQIGRAHV